MASPFEALGAAAAIAQFVEYGVKLTSTAVEIYKSSAGITRAMQEMDGLIKQFERINNDLISRYESNAPRAPGEKAIHDTASKCRDTAAALLLDINELRVTGSNTITKSLSLAIKTQRKRTAIEKHEKHLKKLRQLLNEQILELLRDQSTQVSKTIHDLDQRTSSLVSELSKSKQELIDAINRKDASQVQQSLLGLQREGDSILFRREMLQSLRYEGQRWRWANISDANAGTYEWIFEESHEGEQLRYLSWLEKETGVYWITGKAGSGKSTLMKHISSHKRTNMALLQWANGRPLLTGAHYFWYLGVAMQKSYEGLLQSLLYDILRKQPELIDHVCAQRKVSASLDQDARLDNWTLPELRESMKALSDPGLKLKGQQVCFCFFIDGLDEYNGDHEQITQLLQDLADSENVKVCASSRPWEIFHESFARSKQANNSVVLHRHTRPDIEKVVHQELDPYLARRRGDSSELALLIADIVEKSQGVFLWVSLVVKKELKLGIIHADHIDALRKRLESVPAELNDYFQLIFDRIDPFYRRDTARIFKACMQAREPLPCHVLPIIIHDDPHLAAIEAKVERTFEPHKEKMLEDLRKQVNGRCQDLLYVEPLSRDHKSGILSLHRIQFLHRSVQDFLTEGPIWNILCERSGLDYNPELTLFAAYVFLLKSICCVISVGEIPAAMDWSSCALLHAAKLPYSTVTHRLITELDRVMTGYNPNGEHWTNWFGIEYAIGARTPRHEYCFEYGTRDFLAHMIEFGLTDHVNVWLRMQNQPEHIPFAAKSSWRRSYLDHALRSSQSVRRYFGGLPPLDPALVQLLLLKGGNVNEKLYNFHGSNITVWQLYLKYLAVTEIATEEAEKITWMLIDSGAQMVRLEDLGLSSSADQVLRSHFGDDTGSAMADAIRNNAWKSSRWTRWTSYLKFWSSG